MKKKFSLEWLQSMLSGQLPLAQEVVEKLQMHAFEIESVEEKNGDTIIELSILPSRSVDCLSHFGIAKELSAIFSLPLKEHLFDEHHIHEFKNSGGVSVAIESPAVHRFTITRINNCSNAQVPEWMKRRLEAIGQRSISPIVDITNYVQFEMGQPLHAFDAAKVSGKFLLRGAIEGESYTTLKGEEVKMKAGEVVIVDAETKAILSLAGIKGGTAGEVTKDTKDIYLEAASFEKERMRTTMHRTGVITEAGQRFSQGYPASLMEYSIYRTVQLFKEVCGGEVGESVSEVHANAPNTTLKPVTVTMKEIETYTGGTINAADAEKILQRYGFDFQVLETEKEVINFEVDPPVERPDITRSVDLIEEIIRLYGLNNIPSKPLSKDGVKEINQMLAWEMKITKSLVNDWYSSVMTYSFRNKGDIEVAYPIAKDKGALRKDIIDGLRECVTENHGSMPLLGPSVKNKVFEFGSIFTKYGEKRVLASTSNQTPSTFHTDVHKGTLEFEMTPDSVPESEKEYFRVNYLEYADNFGKAITFDLEKFVKDQRAKGALLKNYDYLPHTGKKEYKPFSKYPFIVRDIAMFVPEVTADDEVKKVLVENAGTLCKRVDLFDTFAKEGKKSVAFRLVFQSDDRTMTDDEGNTIMETIYAAVKSKNWQPR